MTNAQEHLAQHYNQYYEGTSKWREVGAVDKADHIRALWRRSGGSFAGRVVDIGCGEGAVAERLVGLGFEVDGFDISTSGVEACRKRGGAATYAIYDGVRLPVHDKTYELAVLSHVVEHVAYPRMLLSEARRVARKVYIEVPLEVTVRTPKHFKWTDLGHINLYTALTIRHLVESCGLRVLAEQSFDNSFAVAAFHRGRRKAALRWALRRLAHRIWPAMARRLFVYHYGILAEVVDTFG